MEMAARATMAMAISRLEIIDTALLRVIISPPEYANSYGRAWRLHSPCPKTSRLTALESLQGLILRRKYGSALPPRPEHPCSRTVVLVPCRERSTNSRRQTCSASAYEH